jgi:hypothetical protein
MKQALAAMFMLMCSVSTTAQQTITHQIGDDGFVEVPLQFVFPYYGQYFTNSWMYDNGVVGFYSPFNGYNGGQSYFSQPFSANMGGQFSYMIAPLWTDLINYSGTFTTQGNSQVQRYSWNNISQWGYPDNLNTFSLEITPSGSINFQYDQVNIQGYPVSTGTTGNLAQNEFEQMFYAPSGNTITTNDLVAWNEQPETNPCETDPLSSSECPGYALAYLNQQQVTEIETTEAITEVLVTEIVQETIIDTSEVVQPAVELDVDDTEQSESKVSASVLALVLNMIQNQNLTSAQSTNSVDSNASVEPENVLVSMDFLSETTDQIIVEESLVESALSLSQSNDNFTASETTAGEVLSNDLIETFTVESEVTSLPVTNTVESTIDSLSNFFNESDTSFSDLENLTTTDSIESTDTNADNSFETMFMVEIATQQNTNNFTDGSDTNTQATSQMLEQEQEHLTEVNNIAQESIVTSSTTNNNIVFENNTMQQLLALGGNITQILTTAVPDFRRFDIKPPTQDEQVQTARVESQLQSMDQQDIEEQAGQRIGSMDPESQTIALQLIGYKAGFDQYGGTITDQTNWYQDRVVYANNRVPNAIRSNLIFGAQDQRHQELMSLQYRR